MWINPATGFAAVAPLLISRETPQEHSHQKYLDVVHGLLYKNNTYNIIDPIFGLLIAEDAAQGAGSVTDMACLQLATADSAFTNAKADNDVDGMVAALIYRALERNTNSVGAPSPYCISMTASNSEVAALLQHQDPAGVTAPEHNRAVVLELARQINIIGGDATLALEAGTFAPGVISDATAKGNSCNDENCIYQNNRLQALVSEADIGIYVANCVATVTVYVDTPGPTGPATSASFSSNPSFDSTNFPVSGTSTSSSSSTNRGRETDTDGSASNRDSSSSPTSSSSTSSTRTSSSPIPSTTNLQEFTGSVGGISAPAVTQSGARFFVEGNSFNSIAEARQRSCSIQKNNCADEANRTKQWTVADCDAQDTQCAQLANSS